MDQIQRLAPFAAFFHALRARFRDSHRLSVQTYCIELLDGIRAVLPLLHLDEPESL